MRYRFAALAVVLLSKLCLTQATRLRHQARLSKEIPRVFDSEEWWPPSTPSLSPSPPASIPPQQNSATTAPPITTNASVPTSIKSPFATIDDDGFLGNVGIETELFHEVCRRLCRMRSKRMCRFARSRIIPSQCKPNLFLGFKSTPSRCFFAYCGNSYKSVG